MFSIFLVALLPLIFIPVVLFLNDPNGGKLLRVLVLAYFARIFWWRFLSDLPFFSYGAGGDANYYEMLAEVITKIWQHDGIHYITRTEFPPIGRTSLPINLFAFVIHMGGVDGGRMGSTAIVAACACLTAVNFYRLAIELGATPRVSFRATCVSSCPRSSCTRPTCTRTASSSFS
jgi:hypothetical protein